MRRSSLTIAATGLALAAMLTTVGCQGQSDPPAAGRSSSSSAPPSASPSRSPVPLGTVSVDGCRLPLGAQRVVVPTADGVRLTGVVVGSGTRGVALFHTSDGDVCQWAQYAWRLSRNGMQVLAIDARGRGSSPDPAPAGGVSRFELDGPAAVTWLRAHGVTKVGLAGASAGGTLALVTAEQPGQAVTAVASLSGPQKYLDRLDAFAGRARLPADVLLIVGALDGSFATEADALKAAVPRATLIKADAGEHGTRLLPKVVGGVSIEDSLTAFFVRSLG